MLTDLVRRTAALALLANALLTPAVSHAVNEEWGAIGETRHTSRSTFDLCRGTNCLTIRYSDRDILIMAINWTISPRQLREPVVDQDHMLLPTINALIPERCQLQSQQLAALAERSLRRNWFVTYCGMRVRFRNTGPSSTVDITQ